VPLIWEGDGHPSPHYNERGNLYDVGGLPHCQIGGRFEIVGGGINMYPSYLSRYNNLIDTESPVDMELSLVVGEGGALSLETTVEVTEEITTTNNKYIVVVTNKYNNEYFSTVAFYDEEQFPITAVGETQSYTTALDLGTGFDFDNLGIGVIVQTLDDNTAVLGARYYPVNELMDPVVQETLAFGEVQVGDTATLPITITNYWDTPLVGQFISQGVFTIQETYEVAPFSSADFDMNFTPTAVQTFETALIVIMSNETFPNDIINISGIGIATSADQDEVPATASLLGNYPNPFNPNTTISYSITSAEAANAELKIFDAKGKEIKTFANLTVGENSKIEWNGTDNDGKNCPSGVYFYQLNNVNNSVQKKMVLMK